MLGRIAFRKLQIALWSRWLGVVGLRRCARGKCIQRGAIALESKMELMEVFFEFLWPFPLKFFVR